MVRREIAPGVPPVPTKPTQAEQDEHHATGHAAYRSFVSKVEDVHLHMRLFLKESCQKLESTTLYLGPEGSQATILVCKCKRTGCLTATQVPEKGMNVYTLAFFTGWLRGLGWK